MVNAVRGLGDRLVSGRASPDEWIITKDQALASANSEDAVGADEARSIAELVRAVAGHLGEPQDIEWAISGKRLYLLQARPITGILEPVPIAISPPPGFWQRDDAHMPRPLSPMYRSFLPSMTESFRQMFEHFGFLVETIACEEIGGWGYVRVVPLGGKDRRTPPAPVFAAMCRLLPSLHKRVQRSVAAVREDLAGTLVERWYERWQPELEGRASQLRSVELAELSDEELAEHFKRAAALHEEGNQVHFLLQGALYLILAELDTGRARLLLP